MASNQNISCHKSPYSNTEKTEKPQRSDDPPMSKRIGDSGKKKLSFNRKKPSAEPGSDGEVLC